MPPESLPFAVSLDLAPGGAVKESPFEDTPTRRYLKEMP